MSYGPYPNIVSALRIEAGGDDHRGAGGLCRDAADEIERLRATIKRSMIAIDDWLNTYASDLCDDARVAEAHARIGEMGTLAYIADVQQQNRAALADEQVPEDSTS